MVVQAQSQLGVSFATSVIAITGLGMVTILIIAVSSWVG